MEFLASFDIRIQVVVPSLPVTDRIESSAIDSVASLRASTSASSCARVLQ